MKKSITQWLLMAAFILAATSLSAVGEIDTSKLAALKPRSIGPAAMSGRVTAIAVSPINKNVIYAGTASGGLWKSPNGGVTWSPIFDDQGSSSIGAVAIDPLNPDVIWVGTGEGNPRNSQSVGDGLYKSVDGGRSWTHLGLKQSEHIHRIRINPNKPDVVYVASVGPTWSDGEERGVYKTVDGGMTWTRVLHIDERTGIADLEMDPRNPDKLIAAAWEHRRSPHDFVSGGPGSGIYVTYDGGKEWKKRTAEDGLPKGILGRVGLAISASRPNVVYALVEAKKSGLYRSDDGGHKWNKVSEAPGIGNRPFYYFDIRVDPQNENRVISLHSTVTISEDGGKSFSTLIPFAKLHPDHHAFWIDPDNPDYMIDGNDGGLGISRDGGKNWRYIENLPVGQFYHINVDMDVPFNVYGGLQDNGSFAGPSHVWEGGFGGAGILNSHWQMVSFGDGFDVVPDPTDSRYGYSMSQGGNLYRYDRLTRTTKFIRPPAPDNTDLRFNWNAGIAVDPFDPATVYYGSQFVHRSTDRGESWEIISPDLTTNDPERQKQLDSGGLTYDVTNAENNTTIVAIAPSPVRKGVIWVGTDDGNVQVTTNGGRDWRNVVANISGVPAGNWVPHIEASKFHAEEAFVVFDDHRRGNWTPYVFKTTDSGQSWTNLATDNLRGYVYVIEQDPEVENLLFLGTEFHLYVSVDGGKSWTKWDQGYPTVPTMDLVVHPRDGDLVIGTFGRAIYVMDDITPLRKLAREGADFLDAPLELLSVPPAYQVQLGSPAGELIAGDAAYKGENRPFGALLSYVVNPPEKAADSETTDVPAPAEDPAESDETADSSAEPPTGKQQVKIEILQGDEVIRTLKGPAKKGLNRFSWRLDRKRPPFPSQRPPRPDAPEPGGIPVNPGEYQVRVTLGEHQSSQTVRVLGDPRVPLSDQELEVRNQLIDEYGSHVERVAKAYDRLREAKKGMDRVDAMLKDAKADEHKELRETAKETREALKALDEMFFPPEVQGIRRDPKLVTSRIFATGGYVNSQEPPNPTERAVVQQMKQAVDAAVQKIDSFFDNEWDKYRKAVDSAQLSPLP